MRTEALITVVSAGLGAVLLFPLTGLAAMVAPLSLLIIAGVLACGIALVCARLAATSSTQDSANKSPHPVPP
ncbi:MAG: hypothetical protein ABI563_14810 [Specibacter sp.]